MLSVIFISWSILKPSPWLSVLGCCCCWESACSHCPFAAVGSTTTAASGTAVESGGVESVIFSAGCGSNEALQKCHTWARSAGFRLGRDPEREGGRHLAGLRIQLRQITRCKMKLYRKLGDVDFKTNAHLSPAKHPKKVYFVQTGIHLSLLVVFFLQSNV